MKLSPVISVIVPVYKVEKYIHRCLDSIVAQTYTHWECILVDDGSPDTSGQICDEYAMMDERFKVIHQNNAGVSAARNTGLAIANGEWFSFIDSDDWIEPNTYEVAYNRAIKEEVDMIQWGCVYESGKKKKTKVFKEEIITKKNILSHWEPSMWNKLVSSKLINDHKISFPKGIKLSEDRYFSFMCFINAHKCLSIKNVFYHYQANVTSATHSVTKDMIMQEVEMIKQMEKKANGEMKNFINEQKIECKEHILLLLNPIDFELCRNIFPDINKNLLTKSGIKRKILFYLLEKKMDTLISILLKIWKKMR